MEVHHPEDMNASAFAGVSRFFTVAIHRWANRGECIGGLTFHEDSLSASRIPCFPGIYGHYRGLRAGCPVDQPKLAIDISWIVDLIAVRSVEATGNSDWPAGLPNRWDILADVSVNLARQ
jgi:hypothetical protein